MVAFNVKPPRLNRLSHVKDIGVDGSFFNSTVRMVGLPASGRCLEWIEKTAAKLSSNRASIKELKDLFCPEIFKTIKEFNPGYAAEAARAISDFKLDPKNARLLKLKEVKELLTELGKAARPLPEEFPAKGKCAKWINQSALEIVTAPDRKAVLYSKLSSGSLPADPEYRREMLLAVKAFQNDPSNGSLMRNPEVKELLYKLVKLSKPSENQGTLF